MQIEYDQNPLKAKIILGETGIYLLRLALAREGFEDKLFDVCSGTEKALYDDLYSGIYAEVERVLPYHLAACNGEKHFGDCTKVATSCTKCRTEELLGINTIEGIRHPYYVDSAFSKERTTLTEAIDYLQSNPAKTTYEGSEKHVARWQEEINQTVEDLIAYKKKHNF